MIFEEITVTYNCSFVTCKVRTSMGVSITILNVPPETKFFKIFKDTVLFDTTLFYHLFFWGFFFKLQVQQKKVKNFKFLNIVPTFDFY